MITLKPHVSITETEHGMVLLDERAGRYWVLNETGAVIVRHLLAGSDPQLAITALQDGHPENVGQIAQDADDFVQSLLSAGLVTK